MSIDTDYAVLRAVLTGEPGTGFETLAPAPDLSNYGEWAVEFGVYSGYSLGIIAEHMPVIGFDSFEGLPEDWRPGFPKETFGIGVNPEDGRSIQDVLMMGPNRMIVSGWFEDTVPKVPFPHLSLVHIDCDLYSSTVTALNGVLPYIHAGTVIVFDEYHGYPGWQDHESKAWHEFCATNGVTAELIALGDQEAAFVIEEIYVPGPADLGAV